MFKLPVWLIAIIVLNVAIFIIAFRPNPNANLTFFPNASVANNQTIVKNVTNVTNQTNKTNQTKLPINTSIYLTNCLNSIGNYRRNLNNITGFSTVETLYFNDSDKAVDYIQNHSTSSYEVMGIAEDIFALNKSVVSLSNIKAGSKNITLPIVCDVNGTIGNYSACALSNVSNITIYCHNLTEHASECDLEKAEHEVWDDITYWISPNPGVLNVNQSFNFTIVSTRNRLQYASLFIDYIRPSIEKNLFNQSKFTLKGDKISITTKLNLTGKIYGGVILTTYFKKRCYKYQIISKYMYG